MVWFNRIWPLDAQTQKFSHGLILRFLVAVCDFFENVQIFISLTLPGKFELKIC